jgi:hypothetical protein
MGEINQRWRKTEGEGEKQRQKDKEREKRQTFDHLRFGKL